MHRVCRHVATRCVAKGSIKATPRLVWLQIIAVARPFSMQMTSSIRFSSSSVEFTEEDLEAVFSDDDFEQACNAMSKAGLVSCHDLLRNKAFSNIADNFSGASASLWLAIDTHKCSPDKIKRACVSLCDDIIHTDARVVGLLRQATEACRMNAKSKAPGSLVSALYELQQRCDASGVLMHSLFSSFLMALNTLAGSAFLKSLQLADLAILAMLLQALHENLQSIHHPRSRKIESKGIKRSALEDADVHMLLLLVADIRRHIAGMLQQVSPAEPSGLHSKHGPTQILAYCSSLSSLRKNNDRLDDHAVSRRILDLVGRCQTDGVALNASQGFLCFRAVVENRTLFSNAELESALRGLLSISVLQAVVTDMPVLLDWFTFVSRSHLPNRVSVLESLGRTMRTLFEGAIPDPNAFTKHAMSVYKKHAEIRLVNPSLFAAVEEFVIYYYAHQRHLDREDLLDLPEFCWVMQQLRVFNPVLVSTALEKLQTMPVFDGVADAWWRSSLRLAVFASQAGQCTHMLPQKLAKYLQTKAPLRATRAVPYGDIDGPDSPLWRRVLPPLHEFRDHTDFLQMAAYNDQLTDLRDACTESLSSVHAATAFLQDTSLWEPLLQRGMGDSSTRSFILALQKLIPVQYRAIIAGGDALLQPWLWSFICHVGLDRRLDNENVARPAAMAEQVSIFEQTVAATIRKLTKTKGLGSPRSNYFIPELALYTDLAWPSERCVVEVDGPVHYIPTSSGDQAIWLASKLGRDGAAIIDDKRPDIGFLSIRPTVKTSLRREVLQSVGWKVYTISCHDIWTDYLHLSAPKPSSALTSKQFLIRLEQLLAIKGLWNNI